MATVTYDTLDLIVVVLRNRTEELSTLRKMSLTETTPPPQKKVKNVSLTMRLQTKTESCNHNQRRPELPYNASVQNFLFKRNLKIKLTVLPIYSQLGIPIRLKMETTYR